MNRRNIFYYISTIGAAALLLYAFKAENYRPIPTPLKQAYEQIEITVNEVVDGVRTARGAISEKRRELKACSSEITELVFNPDSSQRNQNGLVEKFVATMKKVEQSLER